MDQNYKENIFNRIMPNCLSHFFLHLFHLFWISHLHSLTSSILPLQGCCAAAQVRAGCAVRGQESDPDGHEFLWGPDRGCDRGRRSGCCHSQSGARTVARAGGQASHVDGWCRRGSPWKALRGERDTWQQRAPLIRLTMSYEAAVASTMKRMKKLQAHTSQGHSDLFKACYYTWSH